LAGECKHEFHEDPNNPLVWRCVKCGMVVKGYEEYIKAMGIKLKKSRVFVGWTEDGYGQVTKIICKCGYVDKNGVYVEEGKGEWRCPNCGNMILFRYKGIVWEEWP
jgi:uncharacterized C2H2 Zn-finger protein